MSVRLALLLATLAPALCGCTGSEESLPVMHVSAGARSIDATLIAETADAVGPVDPSPAPISLWKRYDFPDFQCSMVLPRAPERIERPSGGFFYRCQSGAVDFWIRSDRPPQESELKADPDLSDEVMTTLVRERAQRFGAEIIDQKLLFHRGMRTVRTTLIHFNAQTVFYWQHTYDHHAGRIVNLGVSAFEIDADREAEALFQSLEIEAPPAANYQLTADAYRRELAADPQAATRTYGNAIVELTGRVSGLRIEAGEFAARHRIVALSHEGQGDAGEVCCSIDGAPWERLSPGAAATIRGRAVGLPDGLLVNCEIVQADGEPCVSLASADLARELAGSGATGDRYEGRWIVLSGTVVRNHTSELRDGRYGVLLSGKTEKPVFCQSSPARDPSFATAVYGARAMLLGRYSAEAQRAGEFVLADCFLIESVRR